MTVRGEKPKRVWKLRVLFLPEKHLTSVVRIVGDGHVEQIIGKEER